MKRGCDVELEVVVDLEMRLLVDRSVPLAKAAELAAKVERIIVDELATAKANVQTRFDLLVAQTSKWTGSDGDQKPPMETQAAPSSGRRSSE